jgi:hypothetical protein
MIDQGMAIKGQIVAVVSIGYLNRLFYDHILGQVDMN